MSLIVALMSVLPLMAQRVKVACVGNSVTYGYGLPDRDSTAYPVQLQRMLGDGYEVGNFGKSGATLLRHGHRPYTEQEEYRKALDFGAEIVVVHLGLNDTDPRNWPNYRDEFEQDYRQLIDSLQAAAPGGKLKKLVVCLMTPIFHGHHRFESGTRDWHAEIQQAIRRVAMCYDVEPLDLYTPLHCRPDLFPDNLHPNAEGARILAQTVYGGITGDWGGLALAEVYSDGMVVQHDAPALAGRSNAGTHVRVSVKKGGKRLQQTECAADNNGHWRIQLEPLQPGGPYTFDITTERGEKITLSDVLAGEVWLCSGQSNMAFRLDQCATAGNDVLQAPLYGQHTEGATIRLFNMRERWATDNSVWPEEARDEVLALRYFNPTRWTPCNAETAAAFSAIGYHFGRVLADSLQMPVGLICNAVGGSTTEAWVGRTTLEKEFPAILRSWLQNDFIQDWARGRAAKNLGIEQQANADAARLRHPYLPAYLFEAAIAPLDAFPIKGVAWYQGESNAHNKDAHDRLFTLLVDSWRMQWNQLGLPFYFVQLSSLDRPSWPWFRDGQRILQSEIRNTGMVVCTDLGDSLDVHPRRKREVGERLARQVLHERYGFSHIVPSGPLPETAVFTEGKVFVYFSYGEGMHGSDGTDITTFEVAGADGRFYPAKVCGIASNRLEIAAPEVPNPVSVRYGWQPFTRANLVNAAGLPATTFRLDK